MTLDPAHGADDALLQRLDLGGDGFRVGIKDSLDIAGYPTGMGSAAFARAPPATQHAAVVQSLLDAGCRIVGKTRMHELAYGVTGVNRYSGTPRNRRYPERIPGGSSSGSAAAVAGRQVDFAIGTDTGGSIRIPATCCGVYGLKPTYGRVSREGVHPAESSLDCVGPFARSIRMLEHAMSLIDTSFRVAALPSTPRLGMVNVVADSGVVAAVRALLSKSALPVLPITLPSFEEAFAAGLSLLSAENWRAFGHLADTPAMGADVRARLLAAREVSEEAVAAAEVCRTRFRAEVDAALERVDALVLPTLPDIPPTLDATLDARAALRLTALVRPFNLSGHPAISIPLETHAHLPAGLQIVGLRGADAALCALAHRLVDHRELS